MSPAFPTVNVVMRTRNRPLLLQRALDDVLAQSFDDWHLTIVNDGGDAADVDTLVDRRSHAFGGRLSVVHNLTSRGMEAASNQGVETIVTRYVAIHDDDDTWESTFLQETVDWMQSNPGAPGVAVRTRIVWESVEGGSVRKLSDEIFLPERSQVTLFDLLRFNSCVPISMLYRRESLVAVGLFDESLAVTGDWEANLRLAATGSIGYLGSEVLANWHQRPSSRGDLGNSVVAAAADHRVADRLVRDRALRAYVNQQGQGLPLYLTKFLDERFDETRGQLDEILRRLETIERFARDTPYHRLKHAVRGLVSRRRGA